MRRMQHTTDISVNRNPIDPSSLGNIPSLSPIDCLDDTPTFVEIESAINGLNLTKASSIDYLLAEILRYSGWSLKTHIHPFSCRAWTSHSIPQQWKEVNIVAIYNIKGDREVGGNS